MSLSPEQLEQRAEGITGTDIGAIAGLSPWKRPIDVWLEKTGKAPPFEGNERTKWGNLLEPVIRADYEERHDVRVEVPGTLIHPRRPWWRGSPDGIVYRGASSKPERGLEIKVHGREAILSGNLVYGPAGSDEVPAHELVQCQWYMGMTGILRWDLVAFLDGAPVEYCIERDDELLAALCERAEQFLRDHVQKGDPPEPDGSDGWDNWLATRWKKNNGVYLPIDSDADKMRVVGELRRARSAYDDAEQRVKAATQVVKALIGERDGMEWREEGYKTPRRINWKFSKGKSVTDFESAYTGIAGRAKLLGSAIGPRLENAINIIKTAPEGSTISSGTETMKTSEVVELLTNAREFLLHVASDDELAKNTREAPGPRVFTVPRSWGKDDAADAA